jgi:hypothetical protein
MFQPVRLFVASLALLLAAGPAFAQSDGNVMRERAARPKDKAAPPPSASRSVTIQFPAPKPASLGSKAAPKDDNKLSTAPGAPAAPEPKGDPAKKPTSPAKAAAASPPVVFYVAKGEPDACGPGCSEWIAAEGRIDAGAAARFRALLGRLGGRKLPVYFNSPGGLVGDALEIGRTMRQRGMTAGVGQTVPDACGLTGTTEVACLAVKRSGREVQAALNTARAQCNSACVYVVIGAKERRIAAGARLGVHSSKLTLQVRTNRPLTEDERKRAQGLLGRMAGEKLQSAYDRLGRYITEMGIDIGLLEAAQLVPHEQVRFLTRRELAQFGIDRRPFVEDEWLAEDRASATPGVVKMMYEAGEGRGAPYRLKFVRLACGGPEQIQVVYANEPAFSRTPARPIKVSAQGSDFTFPASVQMARLNTEFPLIEVRRARVPASFFASAAGSEAIELAETADKPDTASELRSLKLSTAGLAKALRILVERCAPAAQAPTGASAAAPQL